MSSLGDHANFIRALASESTLKRAFVYAVYHRQHSDFFYDPSEIEYACANEHVIIPELGEELASLNEYTTRPAFSYFPPKGGLCNRRMIYLPFKDLVARYAFVTVVADSVEAGLYRQSFANRCASGRHSTRMLLEPFATISWPTFCQWQRDQAKQYGVLLKTDISAFYDSVSHTSLVFALASAMGIPADGQLLNWFGKLLKPSVFSYSTDPERLVTSEELRQGLCIGNAVDGFLANVYLHETDAYMDRFCSKRNIAYGRYNDDIRIFANSKAEAKDAILLLQQCLLTKGLNLNSSKTKFASNKADMLELMSKSYSYLDYEEDYDEPEEEKNALDAVLDKPFEHDDGFSITSLIEDESDAKKFCRCLHRKLKIIDRQSSQMRQLSIFLEEYPGCTRYACWLLAETAASEKCSQKARSAACKYILEGLRAPTISSYAKYRLLHHLTKQRRDGARFIEKLDTDIVQAIDALASAFIGERSFDLAIGALYYKWVRGSSSAEIKSLLHEKAPKPIALPLQNVLLRFEQGLLPVDFPYAPLEAEEEEPDAVPEYY